MGLTRVIAKSDGDNKGGMDEKGGRKSRGQSAPEGENQGKKEAVSRKIDGASPLGLTRVIAKNDEDSRGGASVRGRGKEGRK